jgi:DNA-binding transcriptional LysR family regulator
MELRQVEHFLAVVDHGSFTAGARAAQIVQSALSTSIRNLERELGAALFERTTRRVSLSEAGRAFLPAARRVVAEATAAADAVRAVAGLRRGRVAVGTIQWLGPVDLPAELAAFHRNNPDIQINVLNAPVSTLLERLRDGELDLAYLVLDAPLPAELVGRLVYQEDLVLITPPGHRLAEQERLRWAELADQPFIEFGEGTALAVIVQRICAELGVARRLVGQVSQIGLQLDLVRSGIGLAIVPRTLAESASGVAVVGLVEPRACWEVSLVSRGTEPVDPAAAALLDHLSPADGSFSERPRGGSIPPHTERAHVPPVIHR